jgi:hypothetical protein
MTCFFLDNGKNNVPTLTSVVATTRQPIIPMDSPHDCKVTRKKSVAATLNNQNKLEENPNYKMLNLFNSFSKSPTMVCENLHHRVSSDRHASFIWLE